MVNHVFLHEAEHGDDCVRKTEIAKVSIAHIGVRGSCDRTKTRCNRAQHDQSLVERVVARTRPGHGRTPHWIKTSATIVAGTTLVAADDVSALGIARGAAWETQTKPRAREPLAQGTLGKEHVTVVPKNGTHNLSLTTEAQHKQVHPDLLLQQRWAHQQQHVGSTCAKCSTHVVKLANTLCHQTMWILQTFTKKTMQLRLFLKALQPLGRSHRRTLLRPTLMGSLVNVMLVSAASDNWTDAISDSADAIPQSERDEDVCVTPPMEWCAQWIRLEVEQGPATLAWRPHCMGKRVERILDSSSFRQSQVDACLWCHQARQVVSLVRRMDHFLFVGILEHVPNSMIALRETEAWKTVAFLSKYGDELQFPGSYIKNMRDSYTIRTVVETTKVALPAFSLWQDAPHQNLLVPLREHWTMCFWNPTLTIWSDATLCSVVNTRQMHHSLLGSACVSMFKHSHPST